MSTSSSRVDSVWSLPTQNLFASTNRLSLVDLQAQLSEREAHLQREIHAIRVFHNSLSPINRLPPEVLSTIFLQLSDMCRQERTRDGYRTLAWMVVLSVCAYWRTTALQCPALWSTVGSEVFDGGLVLLESVLSRSGNSPLKVECAGPKPPARKRGEVRNGLYQLLATQTARLQTLKVVNEHNGQDSFRISIHRALRQMGGGAPMLKSLVVEVDNNAMDSDDRVPDNFLQDGCGAPLLEQLSLAGCNIPRWEGLPLRGGNLKKLCLLDSPYIVYPPPVPHHRPTSRVFLQSLRQLPHLEELQLRRYLPLDQYPNTASVTPLVLPRLRSITVDDKATSVVSFMSVIRAKNLTAINTQLLEDDLPNGSVLVPFLQAFHTLVDGTAVTKPRKLALSPEPHDLEYRRRKLEFILPRKTPREGSQPSEPSRTLAIGSSDELVLQVSCYPADSDQGVGTLLPSIKRLVDLSGLMDLVVEFHPLIRDSIPPHAWIETFGRLPQLRDITVVGDVGLSFIHALGNLGEGSASRQGDATFEALECVTFEKSFRFNDKQVALLVDVISSRQTIRRLCFVLCGGLTRAHYDMIKGALPNASVEWDRFPY